MERSTGADPRGRTSLPAIPFSQASPLIPSQRALYFPNISGKSLLSTPAHTTTLLSNHTSLVTILSTRISEEHVASFTRPVLEDWSHRPGFQLVQINHQENPLKSMLLNFFLSSLKRSVEEERWGTYIVSGGEWSVFDVSSPPPSFQLNPSRSFVVKGGMTGNADIALR
jgi:hypothetical protein